LPGRRMTLARSRTISHDWEFSTRARIDARTIQSHVSPGTRSGPRAYLGACVAVCLAGVDVWKQHAIVGMSICRSRAAALDREQCRRVHPARLRTLGRARRAPSRHPSGHRRRDRRGGARRDEPRQAPLARAESVPATCDTAREPFPLHLDRRPGPINGCRAAARRRRDSLR
jgi:hypothetical protein